MAWQTVNFPGLLLPSMLYSIKILKSGQAAFHTHVSKWTISQELGVQTWWNKIYCPTMTISSLTSSDFPATSPFLSNWNAWFGRNENDVRCRLSVNVHPFKAELQVPYVSLCFVKTRVKCYRVHCVNNFLAIRIYFRNCTISPSSTVIINN